MSESESKAASEPSADSRDPSATTSAEPYARDADRRAMDVDTAISRRPPPSGVALLHAIDQAFGTAEQVLLVGLLGVLIGMGASTAIGTQLGTSWSWSEEIIRYSVFFIAMAGAALSAQTKQLIAMDFVTRLLPANRRAALRLVLRTFTMTVCVLLVIAAWVLPGSRSETYHVIPPKVGLLAIPIGAASSAFTCSCTLSWMSSTWPPDGPAGAQTARRPLIRP